ncbi:MAG: class I SAM-dependent methyltransferase [Phycisphaeraceae bacterium]|nr:class I SAM-dependent methyltransferase [Phycisphaeraceae bacterium]
MASMFESENAGLMWSWDRYPREHLDTYMVADLEDPRINCQSILSRALLTDSLWPNEFTDLIDAELRFGAVLSWILVQLHQGLCRYDLWESVDNDKDFACPQFISETYQWLQSDQCPIPDYLFAALEQGHPDKPGQLLSERALNTFSGIWKMTLCGRRAEKVSVLEPACGSANDYRFIEKSGLAEFIAYTGIDISSKNIANAKTRYPDIDFRVTSVLDTGFDDASFDIVFVHDLFEHLSPEALHVALAEVMRVTRSQAWLHFFNVKTCKNHVVRPVERYHWNTLSLDTLVHLLTELGGNIETLSIPSFLMDKFGDYTYHNSDAVTLLVCK